MRSLPLLCTVMISIVCKAGNGIKVRFPLLLYPFSLFFDKTLITVFSKDEIVFARTSPKHKLEIGSHSCAVRRHQALIISLVKHAQALGHIVGV